MENIEKRIKRVKACIMELRLKNPNDWAKRPEKYAYGCIGILEYVETGNIDEIMGSLELRDMMKKDEKHK